MFPQSSEGEPRVVIGQISDKWLWLLNEQCEKGSSYSNNEGGENDGVYVSKSDEQMKNGVISEVVNCMIGIVIAKLR